MVTRHTYASTDDLRDYLAGTSYSAGWTSDSATLRRIVEASSRRIDNYIGMQSFGPRIETRYYDIGSGSLRNSPQNLVRNTGSADIGNYNAYESAIDLNVWLISATTVTSFKATDRSSSETLTEGYANDFFLEPYNTNPKVRIKLNEDTSKGFYSGQQTFSILGQWGYQNDTTAVTTVDAVSSTTTTSVSVSSASGFGPAQTILVGTEQMYVTSISGNTLTVERGINGSTAATHSGGANASQYDYPEPVLQACLDLGKIIFRDRDMAVGTSLGGANPTMYKLGGDAQRVLFSLDDYKASTGYSEVYF